MKKFFLASLMLIISFSVSYSQDLSGLVFDEPSSFTVKGITGKDKKVIPFQYGLPLFSVLIDSNFYNSYCGPAKFSKNDISVTLADSVLVTATRDRKFTNGIRIILRFSNTGKKVRSIENLVPLGEGTDKVYITAQGSKDWPGYLCRSVLCRPGYGPVGVILPDNAWHLGFSDFKIDENTSITGLARRDQRDKDKTGIDRWAVKLNEGGWVEYSIYFDTHQGEWHQGLKMMFQERFLYDVDKFDNSMFLRSDLKWMKSKYLMLLQFAWDKKYYDAGERKYNFYETFFENDNLTGGFDIYTLWPTWPRLGLDQRNQFDMYRDIPGGLKEISRQVDFLHKNGRKYFISYNPWDEGTRREDQMKGLEDILRATNADGVVLDTRGASSKELQAAADKVKPGIIMYSEGMAVPKDMPGIVSGRVHDALVLPPPLNMNKFIKPDFAIFRVLQLADDRLRREIATSFFNGYGIEINTMRPGRPSWIEEEYELMGRTTKLLRENDSVFHSDKWVPLIPTQTDSIYVNMWPSKEKTIYTIYSLKPEGYKGPLFEFPGKFDFQAVPDRKIHFVDLWSHQEVDTTVKNGTIYINAYLEKFDRKLLGTRQEGSIGCIAAFPEYLNVSLKNDSLAFSSSVGDKIVISGENPTYASKKYLFTAIGNTLPVSSYFTSANKKIIIQLYNGTELIDERIFSIENRGPILRSWVVRTSSPSRPPVDMVKVPAGTYTFITKRAEGTQDPFIQIPHMNDTVTMNMTSFYIDKYPVTNRQWKVFLKKAYYMPKDTTNYLKHWIGGEIPEGQENFPVVYISMEDAKAYAAWASKRLPTQAEWQYAAQGNDGRLYPWGNTMDSTKCNFNLNHPSDVTAHPAGASPFGAEDMIGNVWQMTNDIYDNGSYYFDIIKGGSYYHPTQSIWYVTGGPLPVGHPEILLLVSPSLDRSATVGFRCVMDIR